MFATITNYIFCIYLFIHIFFISIFAQTFHNNAVYSSARTSSFPLSSNELKFNRMLPASDKRNKKMSSFDLSNNFYRTIFERSKSFLTVNDDKNSDYRSKRSSRMKVARKKYRHGNKGRRKHPDIVGIQRYKNQQLTALRFSTSLCPDWPNDPTMTVICSNGRKFRSVCAVSCTAGFHLRKGTPRKRRCRVRRKGRRRKTPKHPRLSWTGKDDRFECVPACDNLPVPDNGQIVCRNQQRNESISGRTFRSCVATCDPGFVPSSSLPRYCQDNGTWTGAAATCESAASRQPSLHLHEQFECGNVGSLATFVSLKNNYIVAGDITRNQTRVFRRSNDRFVPWQTLQTVRPLVVETVLGRRQHLWLLVGNEKKTAAYLLNKQNKFVFTRLKRDFFVTSPSSSNLDPTEGYNMLQSGSDIYRCKGQRSKTGRSVLIVQKLLNKENKHGTYKRIMRKKFRKKWSLVQCLMFVSNKKLYAVATVRKTNGTGKILIGVEDKRRMSVVHRVSGKHLRNLSDLDLIKTSSGKKYFVFAQSITNGTCLVYEKKFHHFRGS